MASTVGKTLQLRWSVHQSYQAELREAKAALQVGDYRLALGSAHRAWEYFRESVLALLGKSKAEIDELARDASLAGLLEATAALSRSRTSRNAGRWYSGISSTEG